MQDGIEQVDFMHWCSGWDCCLALRFCCGLQAVVEVEGCVLRRHQSLLNTQAHTNKVLSDSQEEEEILTPQTARGLACVYSYVDFGSPEPPCPHARALERPPLIALRWPPLRGQAYAPRSSALRRLANSLYARPPIARLLR